MIVAVNITILAGELEKLMGDVESKDIEGWTLDECEAIKNALTTLGTKASILFIGCMTYEEMAELEREDRNDG